MIWHGFRIWPAVLRQATYGSIKFGTYYTLKKVVTQKGWLIDDDGNERVWCNVLCAVIGKVNPIFGLSIQLNTHMSFVNFQRVQ